MSGQESLDVAQKLYTEGILSYPRTETDFFKEGTELVSMIEEHRQHSEWGQYVAKLLDRDGFLWPANGGKKTYTILHLQPTYTYLYLPTASCLCSCLCLSFSLAIHTHTHIYIYIYIYNEKIYYHISIVYITTLPHSIIVINII